MLTWQFLESETVILRKKIKIQASPPPFRIEEFPLWFKTTANFLCLVRTKWGHRVHRWISTSLKNSRVFWTDNHSFNGEWIQKNKEKKKKKKENVKHYLYYPILNRYLSPRTVRQSWFWGSRQALFPIRIVSTGTEAQRHCRCSIFANISNLTEHSSEQSDPQMKLSIL